jgi:hypothetical protein
MTNQATATAADEQYVVVDKENTNKESTTSHDDGEQQQPNGKNTTTTTTTNEEATTIIPPEIFLKGLSILSPRQKKISSSSTDAAKEEVLVLLPLPPLRPEEPVSSLRSAISEVIGFAHLTRYRLVLERLGTTTTTTTTTTAITAATKTAAANNKGGNKKTTNTKKKKKATTNGAAAATTTTTTTTSTTNGEHKDWEKDNVVSTYTLDGAEMAIDKLVMTLKLGRAPDVGGGGGGQDTKTNPASAADFDNTNEMELDDYGDLSILLDVLEKEGNVGDAIGKNNNNNNNKKIFIDASNFAFRIVLEKYNVASIRDHMVRVRQLLEGNAPHLTTLMGDFEEEKANEDNEEEEEGNKVSVEKNEQLAMKDNSDDDDDDVDDKEVNEDGNAAKDKVSCFVPTCVYNVVILVNSLSPS